MVTKKRIQFELWKECNLKCSFCYLGESNKRASTETKLTNIKNIENTLTKANFFDEYDTVGIIGGEFFQGQLDTTDTREAFFNLIKNIANALETRKLKEFWINATLTSDALVDLERTLDLLKNNLDKVWLLTSFDTMGRFHTQKLKNNWESNMRSLKEKYPKIRVNTTVLLTGHLLDTYLKNPLFFKDLEKQYNTSVFIKACGIPDNFNSKKETNDAIGYFFPKRSQFVTFLKRLKTNDPNIYIKLFDMQCRADELILEHDMNFVIQHRQKTNQLEYIDNFEIIKLSCGHQSIYSFYIDSDHCGYCDKQELDLTE